MPASREEIAVVDEQDVRSAALALPGTTEKRSYGRPGFRVADKLFARLHDEPGVLVVRCADEGEKEALLAGEPAKFFTTPHYDGYPHVLVRLAEIDAGELAELLAEAWRSRAPKRLRDGGVP
jgi:hypothetical protein